MKKITCFILVALVVICAQVTFASASNVVFSKSLDYANDDGEFSFTHDKDKQQLSGSFTHAGKTTFMEVKRGRQLSEAMRKVNPTFPQYEIDIKLSDQDGRLFFVQTGGDSPMDGSWATSFDNPDSRPVKDKEEAAQKSFKHAKKMTESLKKIQFGDELLPEHAAIMQIQNVVDVVAVGPMATTTKTSGVSMDAMVALSGCTDKHSVEIWRKSAFFPGNVFGDHSGTVAKVLSANNFVYQIWSACNHGTCPGTDMSLKCSSTYTNRCGFSQAPPMCSTPLQWDQSDYWNDDYRHVCNDDSYIQYYRIKYDSNPSTSGGTCSDTTLRQYAPDCF